MKRTALSTAKPTHSGQWVSDMELPVRSPSP